MKFLKPSLGELEIKVLEIFWRDSAEFDVKSLHQMISNDHPVSLNTIQSTMERLFRKGFLTRSKVSHAYIYSCVKSREEFLSETMQLFVEEINVDETTFISAFLNASHCPDETTLEDLVKKIKVVYKKIKGE